MPRELICRSVRATEFLRPGMESNAREDQWFTLRNFSLFLAIFLAARYASILFGGESFVYRDFGIFSYPVAFHHREAFWNGEIPLWNPLSHCGIPFLAQWNTLTLYPGSLFYLLLPPLWGLNLFEVAHLWLAGVGMFWLAQKWFGNGFAAAVAGLGFAFSGLMLNCVLWPTVIAGLAWMPFMVGLSYGARSRSDFVRAVVVGAMQMLAGSPEIILFTWAILFTLMALRGILEKSFRPIALLIGLGIFVTALCAVQLLPFLDFVRISHRDSNFGGSFWAMPLWGWGSFFAPLVYTHTLSLGVRFQYDQSWTSSYYPSIALTLLAFIGLFGWKRQATRERVIYVLILLAVLLAMGPAGHVYTFFKAIVPVIGLIRFPIKFVVMVSFLLPLIAAAVLARGTDFVAGPARKFAWLTVIGAIITIVSWAKGHPKYDPPYDNWPLTLRSGLMTAFFASMAAALLANRHWAGARLALLILIPLDVFLHAPNPAPTARRGAFEPMEPPPAPRTGRAMLSQFAWQKLFEETISDPEKNFLLQRAGLNGDLNLLDGVAKVDGFFPLNIAENERLRNQLYAKGQENLDGLMDFMGVSSVTAPGAIFDWTNRSTSMPLITAGQAPRSLPETNLLAGLLSGRFRPREMVVFGHPVAGYETNAVTAEVKDVQISRHKISFAVETDKPTFAVISQSFHPNWRARVNGNHSEILRANYAFQAIPLLKGRSVIEMRYEDNSFNFGLMVSLATLLSLLTVFVRLRR